MTNIYQQIRGFWDAQPCGTTHIDLPSDSREYFIEFDKYYESLYPYLLPFLNLESLRGKRVMEIGLGSGFTLQRIAEVAGQCVGLDLSGGTVKLNQARRQHFDLDIKLIQSSATAIPLRSNSLDAVVSIGCLHHIPDINAAISEIHRVLKPGGVLKAMVYNRHSFRVNFYIPLARRTSTRWRGKSSQDCINEMYDGSGNPYGMVYSKGEVTKLLDKFEQVNFRVENFEGREFLPRYGGLIPRNVWLATLGKIVGLDLYFTAKAVK